MIIDTEHTLNPDTLKFFLEKGIQNLFSRYIPEVKSVEAI